jgi:hypothetical protein
MRSKSLHIAERENFFIIFEGEGGGENVVLGSIYRPLPSYHT